MVVWGCTRVHLPGFAGPSHSTCKPRFCTGVDLPLQKQPQQPERNPKQKQQGQVKLQQQSGTADPEQAVREDGTVAGRFGYRPFSVLDWIWSAGLVVLLAMCSRAFDVSPTGSWGRIFCLLVLAAISAATLRQIRCRPQLQPARHVLPLSNSCLARVDDILVHYLFCRRPNVHRQAICFHGFGASALSWERGRNELSAKLNAEVIAFDAPGFGLTERPPLPLTLAGLDASPYRCETCARIAQQLLSMHGQQWRSSSSSGSGRSLVLLGPSLGAIGASLAALKLHAKDQARALLVLESPAIFAPQAEGSQAPPNTPRQLSPPVWRLWPILVVLPWLLRRLVYSRRFWERGLATAGGADTRLVMHYRWPSLVEGWDQGLARFVASRLHGQPEEAGIIERLNESARTNGLGILLLHGEEDNIVPVENSARLAETLNTNLVRLANCGHVPHEQDPVAFASTVARFVGEKS